MEGRGLRMSRPNVKLAAPRMSKKNPLTDKVSWRNHHSSMPTVYLIGADPLRGAIRSNREASARNECRYS